MPVSDDGGMKKMKHVTCFEQLKILSENIIVTDSPHVYLLQFNLWVAVETHTFHKINSPHHGSAHILHWKQNSVTKKLH